MLAQHCGLPVEQETRKGLRERLKAFQALLREMKPEEGYEWPEANDGDDAQDLEAVAADEP